VIVIVHILASRPGFSLQPCSRERVRVASAAGPVPECRRHSRL